MAKPEKPLKLWKEYRAFFQASTFKGARYLDDAGKILNEFRDSYQDGEVGLEGLRLARPKTPNIPDQIAVDINRIWIACFGDTPIKKLTETSEGITKAISRHIGVNSYTRLGLRALYFKPAEDVNVLSRGIYSKFVGTEFQRDSKADSVVEFGCTFRYKSPPFFFRLMLQPILVTAQSQNKENFTENGFVIDVDVSEDKDSSNTPLNFDRLDKFLRESSTQLITKITSTIELLKV